MRCKCRVHREPCKNKECCYNETAFDTLDEEFYTAVANLDKIDKNFLKDMDIFKKIHSLFQNVLLLF